MEACEQYLKNISDNSFAMKASLESINTKLDSLVTSSNKIATSAEAGSFSSYDIKNLLRYNKMLTTGLNELFSIFNGKPLVFDEDGDTDGS